MINHCHAIGKCIANRRREDLLLAASANERVLSGWGGAGRVCGKGRNEGAHMEVMTL